MPRSILIPVLVACACSGPPALEAPPAARAETPAAPSAADAHAHVHPPAAPTADAHADHGGDDPHAGHHMGAMEATRARLRLELGAAYDAPVPGLDGADVQRGRASFASHCASCHGPEGRGDGPAAAGLTPPPANFTDATHARFYSDAARVEIIRKGSPGTAMPPFAGVLPNEGVLDVYAYVRTLRGD